MAAKVSARTQLPGGEYLETKLPTTQLIQNNSGEAELLLFSGEVRNNEIEGRENVVPTAKSAYITLLSVARADSKILHNWWRELATVSRFGTPSGSQTRVSSLLAADCSPRAGK
jgi:hypothetical protein